MDGEQSNKTHKSTRAGAKQRKKELVQKQKKGLDTQPNRGNNPKAFAGRSAGSHKSRQLAKSTEKREHTMHLPGDDKTFKDVENEPPLLVGVVGPPGSGKSTLIRSLVKLYSHRNVRQLRGPVTVVAGRYRRLTFMECPNTLSAMCDMAKVVDLVLLVIDGNFGFEMETFEFLSIAQVHGFPKIIGVVTHLDSLKSNKALRRRKNMLRHRFWNEVAAGAKFLTLAPMHHGLYRSSDVMKLHRLLVCIETKPQAWRNTHGCVFVDRYEDLTPPDEVNVNSSADRTVALYGYVRGHPMKAGQLVHVPGLGDYRIRNISHQEDPCDPIMQGNAKKAPDGGNTKMRHLSQKQKRMYAPYSEVGGVVYDEDAVYVHEDTELANVERSGEGYQMMKELQQLKGNLDEAEDELTIVPGSESRRRADFVDEDGNAFRDVKVTQFPDEDEDEEEDDSDDEDFFESSAAITSKKQGLTMDEFSHLDNLGEDDFDEEGDDEEEAPKFAGAALQPRGPFKPDSTVIRHVTAPEWGTDDEELLIAKVKNLFVTGNWTASEGGVTAGKRNRGSDDDEEIGEKSEVDGGDDMNPYGQKGYESLSDEGEESYEDDLVHEEDEEDEDSPTDSDRNMFSHGIHHDDETQQLLEHFIAGTTSSGAERATLGINLEEDEMALLNDGLPDGDGQNKLNPDVDDAYLRAKMEKRRQFETGGEAAVGPGPALEAGPTYDTTKGKNTTHGFYEHLKQEREDKKKLMDETLNAFGDDVEKKIALIGYFSGLYVRIVLEEVPAEFVKNFDPTAPVVIGGLNAGEDRLGMVHMRVKRHRWFPKILKAQDPVIISVGWRRIQSQPIFGTEDQNGRLRYLKYSPEHLHCISAFYGPVTPPQSGIVCLPSAHEKRDKSFRVMATGYTVGADDSTQIVKKLKLTGVPQKIQKTTCFVKGMFNSDLEAALFVGAKVKAVSGLRGMIKKVIKGKHGIVRCSFEDKLLMSDIVFIRTWKPVQPPAFCVTVQNLLEKNWRGMRTMRELRRDYNQPLKMNPDSEYKEITRRKTVIDSSDQKLPLSRTMRMKLPFEDKEDYIPVVQTTEQERQVKAATFVAPEPREVRKKALIELLADRSAQLEEQQQSLKAEARRKQAQKEAKEEVMYNQKIKKAKKESSRLQEFRSQRKSRR